MFFFFGLQLSLTCLLYICEIDGQRVNSNLHVKGDLDVKKETVSKDDQLQLDVKDLNMKDGKTNGGRAQTFTFDELSAATGNFRSDCFLGEGGFGKVYKGYLERINQVGCESDF